MERNLTIGLENLLFHGDKLYKEIVKTEVELDSGKHVVSVLNEADAKRKISDEYGFDFNEIFIEDTCWYEAEDMNYFKFSVGQRLYEVKDFGALNILDYYKHHENRFFVAFPAKPKVLKDGLPYELVKHKIGNLRGHDKSVQGELWKLNGASGFAITFADDYAVVLTEENILRLATEARNQN